MSRSAYAYAAAEPARMRELTRLAWPAVLSYILNNSYRINDQFWIKGLGAAAQTAIGATFFVQVMTFAVVFLAMGGTLALVSRATGAQDPARRDTIVRHALLFGLILGLLLGVVVLATLPWIVALLGLTGEAATLAREYLWGLYLFMVPLVMFPVCDAIFIGRGHPRIPMALQCLAVALNYTLNPMLIYGADAAQHVSAPGVELFGRLAGALGIEGHGLTGAAVATGISRLVTSVIAIVILRFGLGTSILGSMRPRWRHIWTIARISAPVCFSIGVYAGSYWALLGLVLSRLGDAPMAGLGIGFQVFEGVSFPCYLGVAIAGSSLVGRAIGARDPTAAWEVVATVRRLSRWLGLACGLVFLLGGRFLVPLFTQDPAVARETVGYITMLAFSQYWVAVEAANEKVLLGSGFTRPILWIAPLGNLVRIPLGWLLARHFGFGAAGVWWAINLSTYAKAFVYWRNVQSGVWLERSLAEAAAFGAPAPPRDVVEAAASVPEAAEWLE